MRVEVARSCPLLPAYPFAGYLQFDLDMDNRLRWADLGKEIYDHLALVVWQERKGVMAGLNLPNVSKQPQVGLVEVS